MTCGARLLIRRARVWTDGRTLPGLHTLFARRGRLEAIVPEGGGADRAFPDDRVVDANGNSVTPGLHDAHLHLLEWARSLTEIDLLGTRSPEEVADRVARHLSAHTVSQPVVGRGWDAQQWSAQPDRAVLDAVAGSRPVVLHSRDFHAVWVNGAALRRCGIDRSTPDPEGGLVVRDVHGEPTGVLREHAVRLVAGLGVADDAGDARAVQAAVGRLHGWGVTSVHDFEGATAHRLLRRITREERTPLRVVMHIPHALLDHAVSLGLASGTGDDAFRIGAVKLFADGTLGSRTAAMLEPYEGTQNRGMDLMSASDLRDTVRRAFDAGLSVAIHVIGDRAARVSLDAFEAARERIPSLGLPPRLEHLQLVHPDDQPRFAELGVAASMQPQHAVTDAPHAEREWGVRVAHAYPWRSLLDRGARLAFGSDAPVEVPSPVLGLRAAVKRTPEGAARAFTPAQRISLDEALTAYTEGAARLAGTWPRVGSLRPSACADIVVWNQVLDGASHDRWDDLRPAATIVGGVIVHADDSLRATLPAGDVEVPEPVAGDARSCR